MRITNNMMTNTLLNNLTNNLNHMSALHTMTSDGKKVHKPSDDPVAIAKILKFNTDLGEIEQYKKNIRDSLSWYKVTESAISDMSNAVNRMRDLAVQAANTATLTPEDMQKIKAEVEELKRHVVSAGNFSYAGKYVFSGFQNDKPLFKTVKVAGKEEVFYNVDITERDNALPEKKIYLVGQSERISVTTNGIELFGLNKEGNVYKSMYTDTSGSDFEEGINYIKGRFNSNLDYTGDNLNVTVNGIEFNVDESALDGTTNPVDKALILERLKNSTSLGGDKLMDVADISFDAHDNLVISAKNPGETVSSASANIKFAITKNGISAKKSELKGTFTLQGPDSDYRNKNLDVVVGGKTYNVDESQLTGDGFILKKELVMEKFRNAETVGGEKLSEVADIFFDQEDKLVIKEKKYGNLPMSMVSAPAGFNPAFKSGNDSSEAKVNFDDFNFDDAYIANHQEELKSSSIFITHNGSRYKIELDKNAVVDTSLKYVTELQTAIDKKIGSGKVKVTENSGTLNFSTVNTPNGIKPEIKIEPVITNKSSLIGDIDKFINALSNYDQGAINKFLSDVDQHKDRILSQRADLGAKTSRMELALERTEDNKVSFTESLSSVEDVDLAEAIMKLKNFENVYNASLATGTKIIQPSLVDFIR